MMEDEILYKFIAEYCCVVEEIRDSEISRNFIRHLFQMAAHEIFYYLRNDSEFAETGNNLTIISFYFYYKLYF